MATLAKNNTYTGRSISKPGQLREIATEWQDLHKAVSGTPFSDIDWINAWAEVFWDDTIDARVATVWCEGKLVAALPLRLSMARISSRLPLRTKTLTMLYDDRVGGHDVLIRPGHERDAAAELLRLCRATGARYMDLTPLYATPGLDAFCAALAGHWTHERVEITTGLTDFTAGWEGYLAKRSSNTRKATRKIERKLIEAGARIESIAGDSDAAPEALEAAFSVSSRSWKAVNGTDIGSQPKDRAFFQGLLRSLGTRTTTRLHVLWLDGLAVASCVIMYCDKTAYGLITDYDDSYAKAGVGRMLTFHSYKEACDAGIERFDVLRKTHFTGPYCDDDAPLMRLRVALRPGVARWIITAEFTARGLIQRYFGDKTRKTGRQKIIGERA